jgi:hypothetical protein
MKAITLSLTAAAFVFATSPVSAKDALELTRQCMIKHGAKRQPDGGVWLSKPQAEALAIREKCRKQSGYRE